MLRLASSPVAEVTDILRLTGSSLDAAMTYQDHLWAVLDDPECVLHAVCAPFSPLERSVIHVYDEEGLLEAVEDMLGTDVDMRDGIVVLGKAALVPVDDEDELAVAAIEDVAKHLSELWPVVDRTAGWLRTELSRACVEMAVTAAHPVLGQQPERLGRIFRRAMDRMVANPHSGGEQAFLKQNYPAVDFVRTFGLMAIRTRGFSISLPSGVSGILDPVRTAVCDLMETSERRPVGVV